TSTKDILAALLRPRLRTVAAPRGFNNELGLPLTLCRIEQDTEVVVTEMAMRGPGQIRDLARIARPGVGVITSIAPAHLEPLGSEPAEGPVAVAFSVWRSQETELPGGGLLINDAWNANPVAMRAALAHLLERANGRRTVAILGEMAELGPEAPRYHKDVGQEAEGVDLVLGVGELARGYDPDEWVPTAAEAAEVARGLVRP